ncbi:MAG TPA: thymidine phosphorylase [Firmicutes bacterium]|nr:thymidine phosphorylase [Bacillota bacterium]
MRMTDILEKKKNGLPLTEAEIKHWIDGCMSGEIPDYQTAALLMAVYFRGMNSEETVALTAALAQSGERLDFSGLDFVADKHSTGGVGDKTTLVLLPLLGAAGVRVAKMSGRGLGHTGGTIDKLSCIPGFRTDLPRDVFARQVEELGIALTGQTPELAPADGKLYALRDVTATVDSLPLIASSVMSKKIAAGAQSIVLDVKTGSGAFFAGREKARELARLMVMIGNGLGRRTVALLTSMEQPLGYAVGNHIEVLEAIAALKGEGPHDLQELCLALGTEILLATGKETDPATARERLATLLAGGEALAMFRRFVAAQGGDPEVTDRPELLGVPAATRAVFAAEGGYISRLDARRVGEAAVMLGAGREKKGDAVDLTAGIKFHKKTGDFAEAGEQLADLFCSDPHRLKQAAAHLQSAFAFSREKPPAGPLILGRIA